MPSFSDSIFLFILALLLFGPKKLPVLARELGKWVGEFRRASNEFKMQMEEELRQSEQAERLKKIEAIEAAAPATPSLPEETSTAAAETIIADTSSAQTDSSVGISSEEPAAEHAAETSATPPAEVLPIAESGELKIMPPSTGLPTPRTSALGGLIDAIPPAETNGVKHNPDAAETVHGN
jgi:sec-independent protein translocase protein TatB